MAAPTASSKSLTSAWMASYLARSSSVREATISLIPGIKISPLEVTSLDTDKGKRRGVNGRQWRDPCCVLTQGNQIGHGLVDGSTEHYQKCDQPKISSILRIGYNYDSPPECKSFEGPETEIRK
jgi:hypothetical protein